VAAGSVNVATFVVAEIATSMVPAAGRFPFMARPVICTSATIATWLFTVVVRSGPSSL
jgi:hypothetical protein